MEREKILVIDFGGQYNQLITRRVREKNVYAEVVPYKKALDAIKKEKPIGLIFTGGPNSVYDAKSPDIDPEILDMGLPILGICYGMQLIAKNMGGTVTKSDKREFGKTKTMVDPASKLFDGLDVEQTTWMSHVDYVKELPEGFRTVASTDSCPVAAMEN
ncbi:MAG: glutamine-hydrolyzing GMP synthase, partial [Peptoniphilaceae bacterium]